MKDNKKEMRELMQQLAAKGERIREIAETCEQEKRTRNEKEEAEYAELRRESEILQMKLQAAPLEDLREVPNAKIEADKILRENIENRRQTFVKFTREVVVVADMASGNIVPVRLQDLVEPLTEGLIFDKLGLPFRTGLSGEFIWPTYEVIEATIAGEAVPLTDTPLAVDSLKAEPQRVGCAIPVSREALMNTDGILESIIRKVMPKGVALLINRVVLGTEKAPGATTLVGPFVGMKTGATKIHVTPTYKELLAMKAKVLGAGVEGSHMSFVMTQAMKCELEGTPKDPGSGIMICENDMISGVPVFASHYIGEGYIGLGDWRYQPTGMFGDISFIVDPYTLARKGAIDFVLNTDVATKCLQPKAFALAHATTPNA